MCRCSFNVHVLVLPRAALGRQHRATMHSLEIPEGKLVPPFGVLGMLRSNAQMPFRVRFDSVRANEFILLLGGWLILAPRSARPSGPAPISPRSPVPFQTQIPFDSASPPWRTSQKVGTRRPATSTAGLARLPLLSLNGMPTCAEDDAVPANELVTRMGVAAGTRWGSSRSMEMACGRGGFRKSCGKVLKSQSARYPARSPRCSGQAG